jgi:hypothetical protein
MGPAVAAAAAAASIWVKALQHIYTLIGADMGR